MRCLLKVTIPVESGNAAAKAGKLGTIIQSILAELKPELDGRDREWVAKGGTHVLRLSGTWLISTGR